MVKKAEKRKLTTIEMSFLGLVWLRQPCSIYAVMKELSTSASSFYKSRAGTTYAVAKRLIEFGLISQNDQVVTITESGIEALQNWLTPPIPHGDIAHSADLVRLRFFFLGVIPPAQRVAFVDDSIAGLRIFLKQCERLVLENEAIGDYFGVLATLSTILETKARIEWLAMVRCLIENSTGDQDWQDLVMSSVKKHINP
jgi:DNA-binding PadR family transcriptional regulator